MAGVVPTEGIAGVGGEAEPERARLLRKQVKVWTGQLVDLSGRNNLLYYRDLKRGTLDLSEAVPERVEDVLAGKVEASLDAMIDHELIAAIAGDKAAQAALRERQAKADATDPNYVPLADEFSFSTPTRARTTSSMPFLLAKT